MKKMVKYNMLKKLHLLFFTILVITTTFSFEFAILGDNRPSYGKVEQPQVYADILDEINKNDSIAFAVNTGDLIAGYTNDDSKILEEYNSFVSCSEKHIKKPYYLVAGNHDIFDNKFAENTFIKKFDLKSSLYYSFDYEDTHFIALNTEEVGNLGKIIGEQYRWLVDDLKKNKNKFIVVMGHRPLFPVNEHIGSSLDAYPELRDKLFKTLKKYNVKVYLCGHEHLLNISNHKDILQIISGGAGAPIRAPEKMGGYHHYIIATIENGKFSYKIIKKQYGFYPLRRYFIIKNGQRSLYLEFLFKEDKDIPKELTAIYQFKNSTDQYSIKMIKKKNGFKVDIDLSNVSPDYMKVYFKDKTGKIFKKYGRRYKIWMN